MNHPLLISLVIVLLSVVCKATNLIVSVNNLKDFGKHIGINRKLPQNDNFLFVVLHCYLSENEISSFRRNFPSVRYTQSVNGIFNAIYVNESKVIQYPLRLDDYHNNLEKLDEEISSIVAKLNKPGSSSASTDSMLFNSPAGFIRPYSGVDFVNFEHFMTVGRKVDVVELVFTFCINLAIDFCFILDDNDIARSEIMNSLNFDAVKIFFDEVSSLTSDSSVESLKAFTTTFLKQYQSIIHNVRSCYTYNFSENSWRDGFKGIQNSENLLTGFHEFHASSSYVKIHIPDVDSTSAFVIRQLFPILLSKFQTSDNIKLTSVIATFMLQNYSYYSDAPVSEYSFKEKVTSCYIQITALFEISLKQTTGTDKDVIVKEFAAVTRSLMIIFLEYMNLNDFLKAMPSYSYVTDLKNMLIYAKEKSCSSFFGENYLDYYEKKINGANENCIDSLIVNSPAMHPVFPYYVLICKILNQFDLVGNGIDKK